MSDILDEIAAYKRQDVAARKAARSLDAVEREAALASAPRGFARALANAHAPGRLALIAEIKKASPSRGLIRADFDPSALARAYASGGAACLSVLTDGPSFQGRGDDLVVAREAVDLPCIRKDFMVDPWQIAESRALGADCILLILAMIDDVLAGELMAEAVRFGMDVLVETHDEAEMARAARLGATLVGVNNRDLRTFSVDLSITERTGRRKARKRLVGHGKRYRHQRRRGPARTRRRPGHAGGRKPHAPTGPDGGDARAADDLT